MSVNFGLKAPFANLTRNVAQLPSFDMVADDSTIAMIGLAQPFFKDGYGMYLVVTTSELKNQPSMLWPGRLARTRVVLDVCIGEIKTPMVSANQTRIVRLGMEILEPQPFVALSPGAVVSYARLDGEWQSSRLAEWIMDKLTYLRGTLIPMLFMRLSIERNMRIRFFAESSEDFEELGRIMVRMFGGGEERGPDYFDALFVEANIFYSVEREFPTVLGVKSSDETRMQKTMHWTIPFDIHIDADVGVGIPMLSVDTRYATPGMPAIETRGNLECRMHVWAAIVLTTRSDESPLLDSYLNTLAAVDAYVWFEKGTSRVREITFANAVEVRKDEPDLKELGDRLVNEISFLFDPSLFTCMRSALVTIKNNLHVVGVVGVPSSALVNVVVSVDLEKFTPVHFNYFPRRDNTIIGQYFHFHPADCALSMNTGPYSSATIRIEGDIHKFAFKQEMLYRLGRVGLRPSADGAVASRDFASLEWWLGESGSGNRDFLTAMTDNRFEEQEEGEAERRRERRRERNERPRIRYARWLQDRERERERERETE